VRCAQAPGKRGPPPPCRAMCDKEACTLECLDCLPGSRAWRRSAHCPESWPPGRWACGWAGSGKGMGLGSARRAQGGCESGERCTLGGCNGARGRRQAQNTRCKHQQERFGVCQTVISSSVSFAGHSQVSGVRAGRDVRHELTAQAQALRHTRMKDTLLHNHCIEARPQTGTRDAPIQLQQLSPACGLCTRPRRAACLEVQPGAEAGDVQEVGMRLRGA
jgi:hypothetical protein